jgi:hypothetical protein
MKKWLKQRTAALKSPTTTNDCTAISLRTHVTISMATALGLCAENSFAAGGLAAMTSGLSTFQIWMYSFAGVLALCYLTWKGIEAFTERAHWSDFGIGVGKVAVVGAVIVLGNWAWNLGTS